MENHQLSSAAKIAASSLTFIRKLYGQGRRPEAAVFDESLQSWTCAVCLDEVCGGDTYRRLGECGHCFHSKCIDLWFKSHSTCPLCRSQVPQIISLSKNYYQWSDLISNVLVLVQDFLQKMCNPLNDELTSMLCGNVRCVS